MIGTLRIARRLLLALALALVAGPAFALGLGQIEVKSQRDQPLLAEIPIISSDPAELEQLQARLPSPGTFARVGLEPPQGVVSGLQFTIALDAQGRPVIRVTSVEPVRQSLLTFLVEVDWGQGRLVREYSALLDAPRTVSAPAQPAIQAPSVAPPNTIVRSAEPPAAVDQAPTPVVAAPAEPAAPPASTPPPAPAQPLEAAPPATAIAPTPAPAPAPAAPTPAPEAAMPEPLVAQAATPGEYPVKAGDTLGEIAGSVASDGYSLDQTMLALLRANPDAFIGGNINLVKQGAVLRVPPAGELASLDASQAAAMVRDQMEQWRQARQPAPQPAAVAGEPDAATTAARAAPAGNTPRVADARLEIVPPSQGSGRRAGTRSGIDAGGEGDMLRQELQQTKETLAARDSEVEELKARVADLEKLQQQQQQMISLKDSELAAVQQRLAASNQQAAAPATAATTTTSTTQAPVPASNSNAMAWVWGGVGLVLLALVGWWLARYRKRRDAAPATRTFNTAAMAASIPSGEQAAAGRPAVAGEALDDDRLASDGAAIAEAGLGEPAVDEPAVDEPAVDEPVPGMVEPRTPRFVDAARKPAVEPATPNPVPAWNPDAAIMPTWHAAPAQDAAAHAAGAGDAIDASPGGQDRIELARAYIDLGDVDTARSLLQEVANSSDAQSRAEASRLLRELA